MTATPPPVEPQPSAAVPSAAVAPASRAGGLAVAALVLGLCGIIPFLGVLTGLAGLILGIVALAQGTTRKGLAIAGIVTGAILPLVGSVVVLLPVVSVVSIRRVSPPASYSATQPPASAPPSSRATTPSTSSVTEASLYNEKKAQRAMCGTNLSRIARGMALYMMSESANNDTPPPDLETIVKMEMVNRSMLHCPSDKAGRQGDYFYLAPVKGAAETTIVACDLKGNHGGEGRNVLVSGFYVRWMKEAKFQAELANPENAAFAKALRAAEGE